MKNKNININRDLPEHYKLMANTLQNLSRLSVALIALSVGLLSNLFHANEWQSLLKIAIPVLMICSLFSVLGCLSYADAFRVPELLTGKKYHELVRSTALPIILFCVGSVLLTIYVGIGVIGL